MNRIGLIAGGLILLVMIGVVADNPASAQPIKAPGKITTPGVYELSEDARGLTDIYGITIECSDVILDGGNHFLGGEEREKSVGVYVNQYGGSITNITVKNLILEKWETGIDYKYVKGQEGDVNLITTCDIVESGTGIHVEYSDYVQVMENQINTCSSGIIVEGLSTYTLIENNVLKDSGVGIGVTNSRYTAIEENNINTCSVYGLEVIGSEFTTITKNGIGENKYAAVRIENSRHSEIAGNNLSKTETGAVLIIGNEVRNATIINNYFGAYEDVLVDDVSSEIVWNSTQTPGTNILGGPYMGGNYWGSVPGAKGFSDTAPDVDGFGIADKPYQINDYNIDYLPLTHTTATKVPEEQVTTPESYDDKEQSANLTDNEVSEPVQVNNTTIPEAVPTVSENMSYEKNITVNISPTEDNVTTISEIIPANNQTEIPVPALIPSSANASILNSSITNAYPSVSTDSLSADTSGMELLLSGSDQMIPLNDTTIPFIDEIPASGNNPEPEVNSSPNQGSPSPVGYILFTVSETGSRVILTTASGNEIQLDIVLGHNLTVPVPTEAVVYTSYRVEKDGYIASAGNISPYPVSGQTLTIPVIMIRSMDNSTVIQTNQTAQNSTIPASVLNMATPTIVTPISVPVSPSESSDVQPDTQQNSSFGMILNATKNLQPVVVSNGVVSEISAVTSHLIQSSAGSGGAIFPSGAVQVKDGGSMTFIINPNEGMNVASLVIDGTQTGPMSEYHFINVTTDHTITASFI